MRCNVSESGKTIRYEYTFEDNTSCVIKVENACVMRISFEKNLKFEHLCNALEKISDIIAKDGKIPTINISDDDVFLKNAAKKSKFKKIPTRGIYFSVWVKG